MMIDSLALGTSPFAGLEKAFERSGAFQVAAARRLADAGFESRTTRVSLPPLAKLVEVPADLAPLVQRTEQAAGPAGMPLKRRRPRLLVRRLPGRQG